MCDISSRAFGRNPETLKDPGKDERAFAKQRGHAQSKQDVLGYLLMCPRDDARWVLERVLFQRPDLQLETVGNKLEKTPMPKDPKFYEMLAGSNSCVEMPNPKEPLREEEIIQWIVKHPDETIHERLISKMVTAKPNLRQGLASPTFHVNASECKFEDLTLSGQESDYTVVAFGSSQYFSKEGEPNAIIDVMRLGNLSPVTKIMYRTIDGSGKAGKTYKETRGQLTFGRGDALKEFHIPLFDDDEWNTTLDFSVELVHEGSQHALIDPYLGVARVKVIDNDAFPTNKYQDRVYDQNWEACGTFGMLKEYCKLNLQNAVVRRGTIKMFLVDQIGNLYFTFKLALNVYLVDYILKVGRPDQDLWIVKDKSSSLNLIFFMLLIPFIICYFLDQKKFDWKVAGAGRAILQKSLLRKFLNYTEESRESLKRGDLALAMTRDAVQLMHTGYLNMLSVAREMGKLAMLLTFQVLAPIIFERDLRILNIIIPTVAFPLLLLVFLTVRRKMTTQRFVAMNKAQDALVEYVECTVANYRIIADYSARAKYVDRFDPIIASFNFTFTNAARTIGANLYFPRFLTILIVGVYTMVAGRQTIESKMSLGMFLAEVQVFTQVGEAWGNIYKLLLETQTIFPALQRIVRLENLATDVPTRCELSRFMRDQSNRIRKKQEKTDGQVNIDKIPLKIENLKLEPKGHSQSNYAGLLEIRQSQLVALVGHRGQGKTTLLKVIGGVVLPRSDVPDPGILIPNHLRVLHISLEPMFVNGTLMDNLTFGAKPGTPDANKDRVLAICKRLDVDESTMQLLDSDEYLDWGSVLSQTQRYIVNLVRAFVANPEVLCFHKPTQAFDNLMSEGIMMCLQAFVRERGLEVKTGSAAGPSSIDVRRPRTCLFTSSEWMNVNYADSIVHVSRDHGIRQMRKHDVTSDMLC